MLAKTLRLALLMTTSIALAAPAAAGAAAAWQIDGFSATFTVTSAAAPVSTCLDAGGAPITDTVGARYTTKVELVHPRHRAGRPDIRLRENAGHTEFAPRVHLGLLPSAVENLRVLTPVPNSLPEACTESITTCTAKGHSADTKSLNFIGRGPRVTVRFPARLSKSWFAHCGPTGAALLVPPVPKSRFFSRDGVAKVFRFSAFNHRHPVLAVDKTFPFKPEGGQAGPPGGTIRYQGTVRLTRIATP